MNYPDGTTHILESDSARYAIAYKPAANRKGKPVYSYQATIVRANNTVTFTQWAFVAERIPDNAIAIS